MGVHGTLNDGVKVLIFLLFKELECKFLGLEADLKFAILKTGS
jgi:hypothetical protein